MSQKFKAVIFDMDGLMFDTESQYFEIHSEMSRMRGKIFTPEVQATVMGKRAIEVMSGLNVFWGRGEEVGDLLVEQDAMLVRAYEERVDVMPGLHELLHRLKLGNTRLAIGTSSRGFLVDILLTKHNISSMFEVVVTGGMVARGKPDPEIYTLCMSRLGLDPKDCAVLEDSVNGVLAGVASGAVTIAIPSELTKSGDFFAAHYVVSSLEDPELHKALLV